MAENKTKPTQVSVDEFLSTIGDSRQVEADTLLSIMQEISGKPPVMWGPSIIGFGSQHYKSEAGREGDMCVLGFSPRKANLTIYFYEGFNRYGEELAKLGKYKTSMGCLYINKLADVDLGVLQSMLGQSYALATQSQPKVEGVRGYIDSIPLVAKPRFDELRMLVREMLPNAQEVLSYGIIGYKIDAKRARVFISGWKDHLAMYPIPKDNALQKELQPYIKGKGTLWFPLDKDLPTDLIKRVVAALTRA